jgi:hypothetical protein
MRSGIFGSAVSIPVSGGGSYETAILADNPFFYFPGNDTAEPAVDQMGNITPSSHIGITYGADGVGDRSTALGINGAASAGITLPAAATIGTPTALTIEMLAVMNVWVSADEIFRWSNVISLRHGSDGVTLYFGGLTSGYVVGSYYTAPDLTGIHHWAVTWDGTTAKLFDNGVEVRSGVRAMGIPGTNMVLGGSPDATNRSMSGRFGGVAWYNSALSDSQILAHAQAAGVA